MNEDVLIPKMKRMDVKQKKIKIPVLNFALIILCTLLIIGSTFLNITIKHYILPEGFLSGGSFSKSDYIYTFSIIPQIPVLLFVCSFLGKKLAMTCVCLYLLLGFFAFPIFALGGGLSYASEYSFGYILAYFPATLIIGNILKQKYSILNILLATICGVLIIHILGISYMSILAFIKHEGKVFIEGWIGAQSGLKIVYDLVLGFVAILVGKYCNAFLKYISD